MAHQTVEYGETWSAAARIQASGETPMRISNLQPSYRARFTTTVTATTPTISVIDASFIKAADIERLTLNDGEYIWFAGQIAGKVAVET